MFPCLEVLSEGAHELPVGHRVGVPGAKFVLGRGHRSDFSISSGAMSRAHCELVFEHQRWWLRDLGTTNGTWVRGARVHDAELLHGDCFELPWGLCFRLLLHEPVVATEPQMERELIEGDDPRAWAVYADWLLEHGDPLGARIASPKEEDDARWLGPLAGFAGRGELDVSWAHGLPRDVVLRSRTGGRAQLTWEQRLALLQRQREFHFLRSLVLDLGSFQRGALPASALTAALDALDGSLPALERFVIGPANLAEPPGDLSTRMAALQRRHPRLRFGPEGVLLPWRPASLVVQALVPGVRCGAAVGASLPLVAPFRVGPPGARLVLEAPQAVDFTLLFEDDRWRFEAEQRTSRTFRHNHRLNAWGQLRNGDLLEPYPGVLLRFVA